MMLDGSLPNDRREEAVNLLYAINYLTEQAQRSGFNMAAHLLAASAVAVTEDSGLDLPVKGI